MNTKVEPQVIAVGKLVRFDGAFDALVGDGFTTHGLPYKITLLKHSASGRSCPRTVKWLSER